MHRFALTSVIIVPIGGSSGAGSPHRPVRIDLEDHEFDLAWHYRGNTKRKHPAAHLSPTIDNNEAGVNM